MSELEGAGAVPVVEHPLHRIGLLARDAPTASPAASCAERAAAVDQERPVGVLDEGIDVFHQTIEIDDSNPATYILLARAYLDKGDTIGAEAAAGLAVETALKRGGKPLAPDVRADMERALGADLSGVRIHTDGAAAQAAESVAAHAFAVEQHILGLQVAINNVSIVESANSNDHFGSIEARSILGKSLLLAQIGE